MPSSNLTHLGGFFDSPRFFNGKTLETTGIRDLIDYQTKAVIGKQVDVVITSDKTAYAPSTDGTVSNNRYKPLTIKVRKNINVPLESIIEPVGVKARIYINKTNKEFPVLALSVEADDIKVVSGGNQPAKP